MGLMVLQLFQVHLLRSLWLQRREEKRNEKKTFLSCLFGNKKRRITLLSFVWLVKGKEMEREMCLFYFYTHLNLIVMNVKSETKM